MTDVAIIGGGVAGCATAALLAEAGADVRVYEREAVAAGASGRNSGILQHPHDAALLPVYEASLELYATLGHGFEYPPDVAGVLVVGHDAEALKKGRDGTAEAHPELAPEWLEGDDLVAAEPALAPGLCGYRLATGRPIPPAAATRAWAARARAAGARIEIGEPATLVRRDGRAAGVSAGGRFEPAGAVVAAAGPWTREAIGAGEGWRAVGPVWGVIAQVRLPHPPRHSLEESGVEALTSPGAGAVSIFTVVTANGVSNVGSSFTAEEPDAAAIAPELVRRGVEYVPALRDARIESVRACARPMSLDGRPLLGPVPGIEGLHLMTGHGAWGVTLSPGSARLVVDGILGRGGEIPPELAAARFGRA